MRRSAIEEQDAYMLRRQRDFRLAADIVTDAFMGFGEIEAVAVIGSVARPLWREVPRFREFRRAGIEVWHECRDLDLAVWLSSLARLSALRRARDRALHDAREAGTGPGMTGHQVEVFLFEPGSDRYLGRLCSFSTCPKASAIMRCPAAALSLSARWSKVSRPAPICWRRRLRRCSTGAGGVASAPPSNCPCRKRKIRRAAGNRELRFALVTAWGRGAGVA